jgi:hypothetical protein
VYVRNVLKLFVWNNRFRRYFGLEKCVASRDDFLQKCFLLVACDDICTGRIRHHSWLIFCIAVTRCTEELRQSRAANRRTLVHCNAGVSINYSYTHWSVFLFILWGLPTVLSIVSFMELAFTINLCSELEFLKSHRGGIGFSYWAGIFKKSMGARHRGGIGFSYRPARLHRLAEFIPWNQCRGPINI